MRIDLLLYAYEPGLTVMGSVRKLLGLARGFSQAGHTVRLVAPRALSLHAQGIEVVPYSFVEARGLRPVTAYLSMAWMAWRLARRDRPDLVYARTCRSVFPALVARSVDARFIYEVNGDAFGEQGWQGGIVRALTILASDWVNCRLADRVVAITPGLKSMVTRRYRVDPSKVELVPSGTDLETIRPMDRRTCRTALGLPVEAEIVAFLGVLYRHQGVQTLLAAAPEILRRCPGAKFLIVGDGPARGELQAQAESLGVQGAVSFTGRIEYERVGLYLGTADLCVAPFTAGRGETSPLKLLDYMAAGRPTVASAIAPIAGMIKESGAIVPVPPDDSRALAEEVASLLADERRRKLLGEAARRYVETHHGWDAIAREVLAGLDGSPRHESDGAAPTIVFGAAVRHLGALDRRGPLLLLDTEVLGKAGVEARAPSDYRNEALTFVSAAEEADRLIKRWRANTGADGGALGDLLTYDGIPLWETAEISLLYGSLALLIDELHLWEEMIEKERPACLIVPSDGSGRVPAAVAKARGVHVKQVKGDRPAISRSRLLAYSPVGLRSALRRWRAWKLRRRAIMHEHACARSDAPDATRKILVLTVNRRFTDVVMPVIRALERDPGNEVMVIDRNFSTAVSRLDEERIPYSVFERYSTPEARRRAAREARRLGRAWPRLERDEQFCRQFVHRGVDLWPLIRPTLRECFTALLPEVVRVIEVTRALLNAERPDLLLLADERPPFQRAVVWACRQAGVPTVAVQDTLLPDLPFGSPISTDWIGVEGESARENLMKRGTSGERIVVTGQPRFDSIHTLGSHYSRNGTLERLGLDPSLPTALVFSQWAGIYFRAEDKRRVFGAIYAAAASIPELQLVVKLHPDEPDGPIERELAEEAKLRRYRILASGDSLELVHAADLVIVFFSTVGHEAILMDRPLIQIPAARGEAVISFTEEGGALDGSNLEKLPELFRQALTDPVTRASLQEGRKAYVRRHVHALDGRSAERVAGLVVRAAGKRR